MSKKNYIEPRFKVAVLKPHKHFLAGSSDDGDNNLGNGVDEEMSKRAYGRFAWDEDED